MLKYLPWPFVIYQMRSRLKLKQNLPNHLLNHQSKDTDIIERPDFESFLTVTRYMAQQGQRRLSGNGPWGHKE